MVDPSSVYVRRDLYEWCETKVSEGRFRSFSDMLDYALGFYYDSVQTGRIGNVEKIRRGDAVRRSVRLNQYVVEGLMATGRFDPPELADYALDFYLRRNGL